MDELVFTTELEQSDIDGPVGLTCSAHIVWELQFEARKYGIKELYPSFRSVTVVTYDPDTDKTDRYDLQPEDVTWVHDGGKGFYPSFMELRDNRTAEITFGV